MLHCGLFSAYLWCEFVLFASTTLIIFFGYSWGSLPHRYLNAVRKIQDAFYNVYPPELWENDPWDQMIDTTASGILKRVESRLSDFEIVKDHPNGMLDVQMELVNSGIQSIIKDDVKSMFDLSPDLRRYEFTQDMWNRITDKPHLKALYATSVAFRVGILFPVRVSLYLTSFLYVAICCILALLVNFTDKQKTAIAVTYCRLYTAGTGLVARYHNIEHRPSRPGVAVSNHLSPNDIQIICADVDPNREYLYIVTGQKHTGIIWAIERLVEQLCPSMWLERTNAEERLKFQQDVLRVARSSGPVLIFPEGYCTNNTKVLQFRKAVFGENVQIHPVALKQNARYGDAFWWEDNFGKYLIRLLTSWATVYDITYLPAQTRLPGETAEEFASRVQQLIAEAIDVDPSPYDGGVYYKKHMREKYKKIIQEQCAQELVVSSRRNSPDPYLSSGPDEKVM
ncbi:unnamed protein product [Bursaphelenchus okinawaensis]|uniref:Phospholipid/glycerol acyltransferase domain-containing protein n=1 Tax=Bursaphelenchus okinawaensis TaxID=465554 RepID=A0A811LRV7_9BILA|nr:unnamed protein product [Bursaphelenchus okinawaensis]CAG9127518.1 unnamed protein product [Bursaphelenchus okinawaensis]